MSSTTTKPRITRVAAYGLVLQQRRMLLCRISSHLPSDAGFWTLPGGGIDFGEDPVEAMLREVQEETGLLVRPASLAGIDSLKVEEADRHLHNIRIIYNTIIIGGALRNELDGTTDLCAWWSYEEAKGLPLVGLAELGLALAFKGRVEAARNKV